MTNRELDKIEEELNKALGNLKTLTALFYARMSGQVAWKDGDKAECMERFKALDALVDDLRGQQNAEWFGSLAPGSEGPKLPLPDSHALTYDDYQNMPALIGLQR